ncbi:MAG: GtrA family protein [Persicimonas sp.]
MRTIRLSLSNHPTSSKSGSTSISGEALDESPAKGDGRILSWFPRITRARVGRLLKFGLVGVSGVGVNLLVFEFFYRQIHLEFVLANALGIVVSIFTNFVLNDLWTWGDRRKGGWWDWAHRLVKYYVSASAAAAVQLVVASASNTVIFEPLPLDVPAESIPSALVDIEGAAFDVGPTLAVLTGIAAGMIINFVASHWWAFRDAEVEQ